MGGGMTKEDIIRMARKAGGEITSFINYDYGEDVVVFHMADLVRFAALVIANNPPQTFMSYQEGYAAGVAAEREACAKVCDDKAKETFSGQCAVWGDYFARAIRARSKA